MIKINKQEIKKLEKDFHWERATLFIWYTHDNNNNDNNIEDPETHTLSLVIQMKSSMVRMRLRTVGEVNPQKDWEKGINVTEGWGTEMEKPVWRSEEDERK